MLRKTLAAIAVLSIALGATGPHAGTGHGGSSTVRVSAAGVVVLTTDGETPPSDDPGGDFV